MTKTMSNTISCGCGKTIPAHGDTTCHCAGCHRSFAGLAAFDRHRVDSRCTAPDPTAVDRGGRGWSIYHERIWHYGEQRTPSQWLQAAEARADAARARFHDTAATDAA